MKCTDLRSLAELRIMIGSVILAMKGALMTAKVALMNIGSLNPIFGKMPFIGKFRS